MILPVIHQKNQKPNIRSKPVTPENGRLNQHDLGALAEMLVEMLKKEVHLERERHGRTP